MTQREALAGLRAMLAQRPPTAGSFADRRARWEEVYTGWCPPLPCTIAEPLDLPGLRGEWVAMPDTPEDDAVSLYIHGGGFTAGTVVAYRGLAS